MWTIPDLKTRAKALLRTNYWGFVLAALLAGLGGGQGGGGFNFRLPRGGPGSHGPVEQLCSDADPDAIAAVIAVILLVFLVGAILSLVIWALLLVPLRIGALRYFVVGCYRKPTFSELGLCFRKGNWWNPIKVEMWRITYVFLWSLLLIVPGIVKGYEYRMIPYLLAENPRLSKAEAFRLSKQMMDGEKGHAFLLDLSFIGWVLLTVCTCGLLGLFYVAPYVQLTNASLFATLQSKRFGG